MDKFNALLQALVRSETGLHLELQANGVKVTFGDGRHQFIAVERRGEWYLLTSVVLGRARVEEIGRGQLLPFLWQRNRDTNVIAFNLDKRGRLIGQVEQLADTLDTAELAFYIKLLASDCDRLEYILSGRDIE